MLLLSIYVINSIINDTFCEYPLINYFLAYLYSFIPYLLTLFLKNFKLAAKKFAVRSQLIPIRISSAEKKMPVQKKGRPKSPFPPLEMINLLQTSAVLKEKNRTLLHSPQKMDSEHSNLLAYVSSPIL